MRAQIFGGISLAACVTALLGCSGSNPRTTAVEPASNLSSAVTEAPAPIVQSIIESTPTAAPEPSAAVQPEAVAEVQPVSAPLAAVAAQNQPPPAPSENRVNVPQQVAPNPRPAPPPDDPPPLPSPTAVPPEYGPLNETVQTTGMSFTPHQIHGNAGQSVTITLVGSNTAHTFTIPSLGVDVAIPAGQTRTAQFVVPVEGISPFYCRNHGTPDSGMHGLLVFH